jgi:hypothetical protein
LLVASCSRKRSSSSSVCTPTGRTPLVKTSDYINYTRA